MHSEQEGTRSVGSHAVAQTSRQAWEDPRIEDLPRLEKLTLQTGAGLDTGDGFKYV